MMKVALLMSLALTSLEVGASAAPGDAAVSDVLARSFHGVSSLRQVDDAVVQDLLRKTGRENLADVGEPFEPTDVIRDDRPTRRFVVAGWTGEQSNYWVFCYEHGGRGYHYHVALLMIDDGEVEVLKAGQWLPAQKERKKAVTLDRVLSALRGDEVRYDNHW